MAEPEIVVTDLSEFRDRSRVEADPRLPAPGVDPPVGLPAGTVTFLLTDIEGSTLTWEAHGPEMAEAVGRHYEILDAAVAAHDGVRPLEQGEGDSLVAAFARASDAVAAALKAQRALLEEPWPDGAQLVVRMALHTGEAQLRDQRYYAGPSIIRCARLRALAHGGQVLISNTSADLLADGLPDGASLLPLGVHRLRDLRQPERVFQLCHPTLPARFPPLRSLDAVSKNLPAQLTSFVGREAELEEVGALAAEHRLVTLTGAGGSGKTRLAAQVAAESVAHPDGVWWIELSAVAQPDVVPQAVMSALGLLDAGGLDPVERITRYFADRRALLVFDNCEHVLTSVAGLLEAVLQGCPKVAVLATSREPLGLPGEVAWRIPPLSLPAGDGAESVDGLLASEAVRLFVDRAADARPAFRIDDGNAATVGAICARLDGIPLAIELAAARVRALTPERILEGLTDRFRLLTGGARTALPRQQTLQASVEWSHDRLSEPERMLFRRLAAFSGGFTLEAAEQISEGDPLEAWEVLTLLADLVDKSLVVFDGDRYRLLQTMHDFAAGALQTAGEADALRDRHADWFLARTEGVQERLDRAPDRETLVALEADHDNLRAALTRLIDRGDGEGALRLVNALRLFWDMRGHYSEAISWHLRALAAAPAEPSPARARTLGGLALTRSYGMQAWDGYGIPDAEAAIALATELGDATLTIRPRIGFTAIQGFMVAGGGQAEMAQLAEEAQRAGDAWATYSALWWQAYQTILLTNRPDLAAPALAALRALADRWDSPYWRAWHDEVAGLAAFRQGRLAEARRLLESGVAQGEEVGSLLMELFNSGFLWEVTLAEGVFDATRSRLQQGITRQDRGGTLCREEWLEVALGTTLLAEGDVAGARRRADSSAPGVRVGGIPFLLVHLGVLTGRVALEEGDREAAERALAEAEAVAEQLASPWYRVAVGEAVGRLARAQGNVTRAEDEHHRSLALCLEYGFRGVGPQPLEALAGLAAAGQSHAEAGRLFGAAQALRDATSHRRWPLDQAGYDDDVAQVRAGLGDEAFEQAWKEGTALSFEAAVAYASRARGERKRPSSGWASLTPAELDVVALAATGLSNAEIGARLFIAPTTAKTHLAHIYSKLGVANRAALAAQATARGLGAVSPPQGR